MRVHVESEWETMGVAVWVVRDPDHVLRIRDVGAGIYEWLPFTPGSRPEPTLRLPRDVFDALMVEGGHHTQVSDATVEALRDTREVRDRLLSLVETGFMAGN